LLPHFDRVTFVPPQFFNRLIREARSKPASFHDERLCPSSHTAPTTSVRSIRIILEFAQLFLGILQNRIGRGRQVGLLAGNTRIRIDNLVQFGFQDRCVDVQFFEQIVRNILICRQDRLQDVPWFDCLLLIARGDLSRLL